jgi:hypothetical protein
MDERSKKYMADAPVVPLQDLDYDVDYQLMVCPIVGCDSENIHIYGVFTGKDLGDFYIEICGWCENWHNFRVRFLQHKGDTQVSLIRGPDSLDWTDLPMASQHGFDSDAPYAGPRLVKEVPK